MVFFSPYGVLRFSLESFTCGFRLGAAFAYDTFVEEGFVKPYSCVRYHLNCASASVTVPNLPSSTACFRRREAS